ncbi:MAG TPA: TlpA disulfide reductase family protein [Anaerolineaceae bacterium]|nr:TlpA disulfide reductase family protein [Anaerolineaceae bacterium]
MNVWISRNWNTFTGLCLLAGLAWMLLIPSSAPLQPATAPSSGFLPPPFSLPDANGKQISLDPFKDQIIVLNFWASWCEPCKQEMPALEKAYQTYATQGVVILGINATLNDQATSALRFSAAQGLSFPILLDENGTANQDYRIALLPTTFFIGRDGIIRKVVSGGMSEAFIFATIEELLQAEER